MAASSTIGASISTSGVHRDTDTPMPEPLLPNAPASLFSDDEQVGSELGHGVLGTQVSRPSDSAVHHNSYSTSQIVQPPPAPQAVLGPHGLPRVLPMSAYALVPPDATSGYDGAARLRTVQFTEHGVGVV